LLANLCDHNADNVTSAMVFEAAERGDEVARAILDRVAVLLGRLCGNVVLMVQPEKIVIVGGLAERCDWVLETINRTMRELSDTAGVLGTIHKVRRLVGKA
jgi:glucokinase